MRHGVAQAVEFVGRQQATSKGGTKIRCIDDFKASGVNAATTANDKIKHNHLDDLVAIIQNISEPRFIDTF